MCFRYVYTLSVRVLYTLLLFWFASPAVHAQSVVVFDDNTEGKLLGQRMQLFEDVSGNMPIEHVAATPLLFKRNLREVPTFSGTKSAIWLKAKIFVSTDDPVFLQLGYTMMDTIELYVFNNDGKLVAKKQAGSLSDISNRDLEGNLPKFKLIKGSLDYYLRVKGTYSIVLPITLKSYNTLHADRLTENLIQGTYIGFAILIVLYTFFLWFSLRDRVYLYYILHIIATAIITLHMGGYTFLFLWPHAPWINMYEPSFFALGVFSALFAMFFLQLETRLPKVDKVLKILIGLNLLVFPLDWLGFHITANYFVQVLIFTGSCTMLAAGFISYRSGFKSARFFLLAWTFFLLGGIITVLQRVGVLPYTYYLSHAWQIGSAIDMVLLSLALADRINILRTEKEKALKQSYDSMRENRELATQQNALLSLRVEERTKEIDEQRKVLELQKGQLEEMNKTKDKIFSVIAHDLRGPLANVSQLAEMMGEEQSLRNDETIAMLKDASKQSFNLLDNLLLWAKAQYGDTAFIKDQIDLHAITESNIQLYHLKAKAKDINVLNQVPGGLLADADATMISTVIRNLISNALKFTLVGGKIIVGGNRNAENNTVSVWVSDSGLGIDPEKLPSIFEAGKNKSVMGTDGETGTGLGLVICKDFVEKNNGSISVKSKKGKGTDFIITLPAFKTPLS